MPPTLTILGLGPGNSAHRTVEAQATLTTARRIMLRTAVHPGVADIAADPRTSTCDDLYERGGSFDEVYAAVIERAATEAAREDLVFAVPGHPLVGERTATGLLERARGGAFDIRIVPGISAIDVVAAALRIDPMAEQAQVVDATELERFAAASPFNGGLPDVSPYRPVILAQLYARSVASAAKLELGRVFPEDHPVTVVTAAGVPGEERIVDCRLFELDRVAVDHLSTAWIPALDVLNAPRWPATLHRIAARLRAPDGCPWDRMQTHASLRSAVIEEAYEVAAAIDDGDTDHLAEELGDLALTVAMHAQIAEEAGDFSAGDLYEHVNRKLVRRHPHVFGDAQADTPDAVIKTWDTVKAEERANKGATEASERDPFDRLPKSMPVSMRIAKLAEPRGVGPLTEDIETLAAALLDAIERLARAGRDPEQELERAYRARSAVAP